MTGNFSPLISIIIPVYNGSSFLENAILSALEQTYKKIEIIVVNDGSTDNGATRQIAEKYSSHLKYFEKSNGGVSTALNLGISKMTGTFFAWLSHDDVFHPSKLEVLVSEINNHNLELKEIHSLIITHNFEYVDENLQHLKKVNQLNYVKHQLPEILLTGCYINGCSCIISKQLFLENGLFIENLRYSQDLEMWIRIGKHAKFIHVNKTLSALRVHECQVTKTKAAFLKEEESEAILIHLRELSGKKEEILATSLKLFGKVYREPIFWIRLGSFYLTVRKLQKVKTYCFEQAKQYKLNWTTKTRAYLAESLPFFLQPEYFIHFYRRAKESINSKGLIDHIIFHFKNS
jgi:glycosyltransferase involved in cell wall biosynthesis